MVPELRQAYNTAFRSSSYEEMMRWLQAEAGCSVDFRVSETPVFLSFEFAQEVEDAAWEVLRQLRTPEYLEFSQRAIPPGRAVPGESEHPVFVQIDFAAALGPRGRVVPRLIELQGFPSLYGFQWHLACGYERLFEFPSGWSPYFGGLSSEAYAARLREVLVGPCDPEQVVLLEVDPDRQKTRIDFAVTERLTGVRAVDAQSVVRRGRRLFYQREGREVEIRRIYNRVIFDELDRKGIDLTDLFRNEIDAEWVGHPNWFFRISKFSLPRINGPYAPPAYLLGELDEPPADLENYVLKPIFSFAGLGVELDVTRERLRAIANPNDYILQRRVEYAPAIATPDGPAKFEIRMMFLWEREPLLINSLVRMSKGAMLGVDFNKDKTWIGASVAFHPPQ